MGVANIGVFFPIWEFKSHIGYTSDSFLVIESLVSTVDANMGYYSQYSIILVRHY